MAGNTFLANTGEIATGTSLKTVLQVSSPTNQRVLVNEISIGFKGSTSSDTPVLFEVVLQSTAGSGGSSTSVINQINAAETVQSTGLKNMTTEPTFVRNVVSPQEIHPNGGGFFWQAPYGKEIPIAGGERLGIRVTAAQTQTIVCGFSCEE